METRATANSSATIIFHAPGELTGFERSAVMYLRRLWKIHIFMGGTPNGGLNWFSRHLIFSQTVTLTKAVLPLWRRHAGIWSGRVGASEAFEQHVIPKIS